MDIGTKKEPGRILTAEEILKPVGGHIGPIIEQDPPPDDPLDALGNPTVNY